MCIEKLLAMYSQNVNHAFKNVKNVYEKNVDPVLKNY